MAPMSLGGKEGRVVCFCLRGETCELGARHGAARWLPHHRAPKPCPVGFWSPHGRSQHRAAFACQRGHVGATSVSRCGNEERQKRRGSWLGKRALGRCRWGAGAGRGHLGCQENRGEGTSWCQRCLEVAPRGSGRFNQESVNDSAQLGGKDFSRALSHHRPFLSCCPFGSTSRS